MMRFLLDYQRVAVVVLHLALVGFSNYLAVWLRFDGSIPPRELTIAFQMMPWLLVLRGAIFIPFRLYGGLWRYTGIWDLRNILAAVASSSLLFYVLVRWVFGLAIYPRSVFIIDSILLVFFVGGIRLLKRLPPRLPRVKARKRVLVFGAGDAGEMIVRDMQRYPDHEPIGFVDDDRSKLGQRIHGVRVLGTRHDLAEIIAREKPDEVLVAVPRADPEVIRDVVKALQPFKVPITTLPSLREIVDGKVALHQVRSLSIEDLLARAPVGLEMSGVRELIAGKRVMVTGAGGSIGSELCRQIAAYAPAALILFERYENGLYAVLNDLTDPKPGCPIFPIIGDVTDDRRLTSTISEHRPQIIFHAAAHKHVPLMEANICEAIKNNVTGTRMLAEAAVRYEVERMVLISTDKAVNPTSVMGASKRVSELLLQSLSEQSRTKFVTVRFGNVLGSNGSVVPRFIEQIKAGGPVTVTHPDIRRYFMMIPEAVILVLQAAAVGTAGETFVLDMGEQIKVVDLARNLIRLSGFVPDEEIAIAFVGLRPGEKLYEEVTGAGESVEHSSVEKIFRVKADRNIVPTLLSYQVHELEQAAIRGDGPEVTQQLAEIVPTFQPCGVPPLELANNRRTRRRPIVVRRRFPDQAGFEYIQVVTDRRTLEARDRRATPRGGRRVSDVPPAAIMALPTRESKQVSVG
ncbi:MAG: NAD-dependent epimerase/dehydratase family protein [Luteitalea sp.]|nr:NAD-dependent epimerase/dehydratase family protein [Luteitalea sp.]